MTINKITTLTLLFICTTVCHVSAAVMTVEIINKSDNTIKEFYFQAGLCASPMLDIGEGRTETVNIDSFLCGWGNYFAHFKDINWKKYSSTNHCAMGPGDNAQAVIFGTVNQLVFTWLSC